MIYSRRFFDCTLIRSVATWITLFNNQTKTPYTHVWSTGNNNNNYDHNVQCTRIFLVSDRPHEQTKVDLKWGSVKLGQHLHKNSRTTFAHLPVFVFQTNCTRGNNCHGHCALVKLSSLIKQLIRQCLRRMQIALPCLMQLAEHVFKIPTGQVSGSTLINHTGHRRQHLKHKLRQYVSTVEIGYHPLLISDHLNSQEFLP